MDTLRAIGRWFRHLSKTNRQIDGAIDNLRRRIPGLRELRNTLNKVIPDDQTEEAMMRLIQFFSATSYWHDRNNDLSDIAANLKKSSDPKLQAIATNLTTLHNYIVGGGRSEFEVNRTHRGQGVTDKSVYLGNCDGGKTFHVRNVREWRSLKKNNEGRQAMNRWSQRFMDDFRPICQLVTDLDNALNCLR